MFLKKKNRFVPTTSVLILFFVFLGGCNINYFLGNGKKSAKNYEGADLYYHRALVDDPDDEDFMADYEENAEKVSNEMLERYRRYIVEKKFLPAYFLLQRVQKYQYNQEYIKNEEKNWLRVLIAGKVEFIFDTLSRYAVGSADTAIQVRFNTPNQNQKLVADINIVNGVYFTEDYLYKPQNEFLMFYTLNSVGISEISAIGGISNSINLSFKDAGNAQGKEAKARYKKPVRSKNTLTSKEFHSFIDFAFPVLSEVNGELTRGKDLRQFDQYYPIDVLRRNVSKNNIYGGSDIRFTARFVDDKISIESSAGIIEFLPQIMYRNSKKKRVFLDFGVNELTLDAETGLWKMKRMIPEQPEYRKKLIKNIILRPYFKSIDGAYPYVKKS